MTQTNQRLLEPGMIPIAAAVPDAVLAPAIGTMFSERARRFSHWAERMPEQAAFFGFMAQLARAQQTAADAHSQFLLPDATAVARCHEHKMPLVPAGLADRDPAWIAALRGVLSAFDGGLPEPLTQARQTLQQASDEKLDHHGGALLAYDFEVLSAAQVPWLAAGLQVHFSAVAAQLGASGQLKALDVHSVCPCCGSLPVASVKHVGGAQQGLRYLQCSLCSTQWHLVRIKCSHCASTAGINYFSLSDDEDLTTQESIRKAARQSVKVETCDACMGSLKLIDLEADVHAEVIADDLATLALDLLVDERGYARIGPNLFYHPGPI